MGGTYAGGDGGRGRVKVLHGSTRTGTGTLTGIVTEGLLPPLRVFSATLPDPTLIYNDDFAVVGLTWDRAFPSVQGYYHRTSTAANNVPTPANGAFVAGELIALDDGSMILLSRDGGASFGTVELGVPLLGLAFAGDERDSSLLALVGSESGHSDRDRAPAYLVELPNVGEPARVAQVPRTGANRGSDGERFRSRSPITWDPSREVLWVAGDVGLIALGRPRKH